MAWKKALFLGGAVLLLAACNSATAPNSLTRDGSKAAAIRLDSEAVTPLSFDVDINPSLNVDECRSGYYVRSGDKDLCWEQPQ